MVCSLYFAIHGLLCLDSRRLIEYDNLQGPLLRLTMTSLKRNFPSQTTLITNMTIRRVPIVPLRLQLTFARCVPEETSMYQTIPTWRTPTLFFVAVSPSALNIPRVKSQTKTKSNVACSSCVTRLTFVMDSTCLQLVCLPHPPSQQTMSTNNDPFSSRLGKQQSLFCTGCPTSSWCRSYR